MFKTHKNILNKKEQKNLLSFVKTKMKYLGKDYPGLQTKGDLHTYKELNYFLKKIHKYIKPNKINKCWANQTKGDYINWHFHEDIKYSLVYYLHNLENVGVMFRKGLYEIQYTKGLDNSLVIFTGKKIHSVPCFHKKINRYTIAMDLI
jgi:hypothetical protein